MIPWQGEQRKTKKEGLAEKTRVPWKNLRNACARKQRRQGRLPLRSRPLAPVVLGRTTCGWKWTGLAPAAAGPRGGRCWPKPWTSFKFIQQIALIRPPSGNTVQPQMLGIGFESFIVGLGAFNQKQLP